MVFFQDNFRSAKNILAKANLTFDECYSKFKNVMSVMEHYLSQQLTLNFNLRIQDRDQILEQEPNLVDIRVRRLSDQAAERGEDRSDEVTYFSCGLTLGTWRDGMHPIDSHRSLSRGQCKFLENPSESGNIDIGNLTTPRSDNKESVPGQSAKDSQAASIVPPISLLTDLPIQKRAGVTTDVNDNNTSLVGRLMSLMPVGIKSLVADWTLPRDQTATPNINYAQDENLLRREACRLGTYENAWNYSHIVTPTDLARNGFFYTGAADRVQCAFCQGILRSWEPGDVAAEQHAKHFKYCRFVQGHDVGNLPIPFLPLLYMVPEKNEELADRENLGIAQPKPNDPDLAVEARRRLTFITWPSSHAVAPESLVKAGFFYLGKQDAVQCFYCGGTATDWKSESDAWVEHAKRFPTCQYVIQVKGSEFVTQHHSSYSGSNLDTQNASFAVDPREISARMDTPKVQVLLRMDYPMDLVREVVQRRLATTGNDHETSEDLLAEVFAVHDEKQRSAQRNIATTTIGSSTQPVVISGPHTASGSAVASSAFEARQPHDDIATATLAAINRFEASSLSPAAAVQASTAKKTPPEGENGQLKTQLMCKICMDAIVGIVFLPCGHLVSCAECAPAMFKCPICRVDIRGTVTNIL